MNTLIKGEVNLCHSMPASIHLYCHVFYSKVSGSISWKTLGTWNWHFFNLTMKKTACEERKMSHQLLPVSVAYLGWKVWRSAHFFTCWNMLKREGFVGPKIYDGHQWGFQLPQNCSKNMISSNSLLTRKYIEQRHIGWWKQKLTLTC